MLWIVPLMFACNETTTDEATQKTETTPTVEAQKPTETANKSEKAPKAEAQKAQDFGAPFTIEEVTASKDVFADPEKFVGKKVRIEGKVSDVCQKMGCWMVISEGDKSMRITTKSHKFFVAKDGAGSTCHIEGEMISRELDPERTAHFESESSKGAPIPEKQAKDNKTYEIVASSIRFIKE